MYGALTNHIKRLLQDSNVAGIKTTQRDEFDEFCERLERNLGRMFTLYELLQSLNQKNLHFKILKTPTLNNLSKCPN